MELTVYSLVLIALLAFVSEYVDSSLGMGYGTTLTPVLLILGLAPLQIVPAVLLSEFVTGITAAGFHHAFRNARFGRTAETKVAAVLMGCGTLGTVAAVALAVTLPPVVVSTYIGAMVFGMGVLMIITRRRQMRFSWARLVTFGVVGAFNKGIGGGGYGPVITGGQILGGLDPRKAVSVTSLTEGVVSLVGIIAYLAMMTVVDWQLAAALMVGAMLSTPLAAFTVSRISMRHLRIAIGVMACLLGAGVILRVASA